MQNLRVSRELRAADHEAHMAFAIPSQPLLFATIGVLSNNTTSCSQDSDQGPRWIGFSLIVQGELRLRRFIAAC
jgi:hypothetical protein